jgi:hypothetical protein
VFKLFKEHKKDNDIVCKDTKYTSNNKLKFKCFNSKNKVDTLNSNSTNSIIKSKKKINIFKWFNKHDCVKCYDSDNSLKIIEKQELDNKPNKNKNSNIVKNFFSKKKYNDNLSSSCSSSDFPLNNFEIINLKNLNSIIDWKNRIDVKYIGDVSNMNSFMESMASEYYVLEHEGTRVSRYTTEYFDTHDRHMFKQHQSGSMHRFKIRKRCYNENELWMEVKEKINGNTYKHRLFNPTSNQIETFVQSKSCYTQTDLHKTLLVYYERITLIHKILPIKVTIDKNLKVGKDHQWTPFDHLTIIEIKSDKKHISYAEKIMQSNIFKKCSISKYCIGMVTVYPELKQQAPRLTPTLLNIKKITNK